MSINFVDAFIVCILIASLVRGMEIGFVRQFYSTAGFFAGLLLGAVLQPHIVTLAHSELSRSLITIITTLGIALICMSLGEYAGLQVKERIQFGRLNQTDTVLGSLLAAVSLLLIIWLSTSIFASLPAGNLRTQIQNSRIIAALTTHLPPAPSAIARLGKLIDPNGFPQVFTGSEPAPNTTNVTPSLAGFDTAIASDKDSVVKIEGEGCGGIVDGSGFVAGDGLIATNAHVVAGIEHPYVIDANGRHTAVAIWFDPDLDFAVLRTSDLAGKPLKFTTAVQPDDTKAAVFGYPGGGPFDVESAVILDQFVATGRNIYGQGTTARQIYEVQAHIIPGNSGGPLVTADGKVIGVVFAESTSYKDVGYTLTAKKVVSEIQTAKARNSVVSTARCAE